MINKVMSYCESNHFGFKTVKLSAEMTGFTFAVTVQPRFCTSAKKDMRAGVSNSDLVSAPVLISLEHLTNLEQPVWAEMQYLNLPLPFLHPGIKVMIYLESPEDHICKANVMTAFSWRAHDYVSASVCPSFHATDNVAM